MQFIPNPKSERDLHLKKLEKKGYIERKRSLNDERNLIVSITKEGEKLKDKVIDVPSKIGKCINLNDSDALKLYELLHKVISSTLQK